MVTSIPARPRVRAREDGPKQAQSRPKTGRRRPWAGTPRGHYDSLNAARDVFRKAWDDFNGPATDNPRPQGWRNAVGAYHRLGVSDHNIREAVRIAFGR